MGVSPYLFWPDVIATVSSKGQLTLPKALRDRLGIKTGSRIRLSLTPQGGFQGEPVRLSPEAFWALADEGPAAKRVMTFEDMDAAKARRVW
jgi:AbrB family looped-hinge helix DNA binding protein